jgi:hypothetical protein
VRQFWRATVPPTRKRIPASVLNIRICKTAWTSLGLQKHSRGLTQSSTACLDMYLVRKQTILNARTPLVGEVSVNI